MCRIAARCIAIYCGCSIGIVSTVMSSVTCQSAANINAWIGSPVERVEDFLIPFAARFVRGSVRRVEDCREHLLAMNFARDMYADVGIACRCDDTVADRHVEHGSVRLPFSEFDGPAIARTYHNKKHIPPRLRNLIENASRVSAADDSRQAMQ